jgi:hypothetical protein
MEIIGNRAVPGLKAAISRRSSSPHAIAWRFKEPRFALPIFAPAESGQIELPDKDNLWISLFQTVRRRSGPP